MLNPSDIANQKFEKGMGKSYKADEVDRFLAQLAGDVGELIEEKRSLEQKLMVLADKLEEYKNDEESLRSALLGAQKLGDSVVRDSKAKAGRIIDDANAKADALIESAKRTIEKEQNSFIRMQREVATFRSKLQLLYKQHLELISSIPVDENLLSPMQKPAPAEPQPAPMPAPAEENGIPEIENEFEPELPSVDTLEYSEQPLEYTTEDSYEPEQSQKRESRFGPLKFGREFDIKRDDDKRKK